MKGETQRDKNEGGPWSLYVPFQKSLTLRDQQLPNQELSRKHYAERSTAPESGAVKKTLR